MEACWNFRNGFALFCFLFFLGVLVWEAGRRRFEGTWNSESDLSEFLDSDWRIWWWSSDIWLCLVAEKTGKGKGRENEVIILFLFFYASVFGFCKRKKSQLSQGVAEKCRKIREIKILKHLTKRNLLSLSSIICVSFLFLFFVCETKFKCCRGLGILFFFCFPSFSREPNRRGELELIWISLIGLCSCYELLRTYFECRFPYVDFRCVLALFHGKFSYNLQFY